jgi:hypothetical protein
MPTFWKAGGEIRLVTAELARAFVSLDRATFRYLKMKHRDLFDNVLKMTKARIRDGNGLPNLRNLCDVGCECEELLWLLAGCCGQAIILNTQQIFSRDAKSLNRNLQEIRNCADLVANLDRSLFGALLRGTPSSATFQFVPENLRTMADLAEAAKRDFKNAEWFLGIAKVRITDHVTYKTCSGDPHDNEVSGLIAAASGKEYNSDAHRRFRMKYRDLFSDRNRDPNGLNSLDPYTVRADSLRQETIQALTQGMNEHAELRQAVENCVRTFARLTDATSRRANRKIRKKSR